MRALIFIIYGAALPALVLASETEHHGIPTTNLLTHAFNLFVFLSILIWALLKKANLPAKAVEKRDQVQLEMEEAEKRLTQAERDEKALRQKLSQVTKEIQDLMRNSEQRAKELNLNMKSEAEELVKKMVEDSKQMAEMEFRRLKEKLVQEIVNEAVDDAVSSIKKEVDSGKDASIVKKNLSWIS